MISSARLVTALGGRKVFRGRQASYSTVVDRVRAGLPYAALEALAARFSIPHEAACRLLHIPPRTLARRKKDRRLRAHRAEHPGRDPLEDRSLEILSEVAVEPG